MIAHRHRIPSARSQPGRLRRPKALILVSILGILTMVTVLFMAMVSLSNTETVNAANYAATQKSKSLATTATNIVLSQIRRSTTQAGTTWASQPGAIRTFAETGFFWVGFKLYSDANMAVSDEKSLAEDAPPRDWDSDQNRARYTDLNAPILREDEWHFPIIDPRALAEIEGFGYDLIPVGSDPESVPPALPMPVEWIYVLADGTCGTLDESGTFTGPNSPDRENPITGRIAFWTDDETAKININTASEPTYWDKPQTAGEDDRRYDRFPPANRECQRYPGHPATTAISPVFSPGRKLTPEQKEIVYSVVPRIAPGGSRAGTVSYLENPGVPPDLTTDGDRLFASPAEFSLPPAREWPDPGQHPVAPPDRIGRSQFFLTAHSSAPEVTLFGTPRLAVWPLETTDWYESNSPTGHDLLIAHCATLGNPKPRIDFSLESAVEQKKDYYFRRVRTDTLDSDIHALRNLQLNAYLQDLSYRPIPGFGGTFRAKYGTDFDHMANSIFSYITGKRSYFLYNGSSDAGGPTYISPNRQVASPIILGSIPSGVVSGNYGRTLLFHRKDGHFGARSPQDHLLLDLFWMPVVEPYAISGQFSTAGKVNMNHQILPFPHILRTTALHAVFGDEHILTFQNDGGNPIDHSDRKPLDAHETLKQFASRFKAGKIFKSASEICDLYLVPEGRKLTGMFSQSQGDSAMGEKTRERNYANLHARLTTQSNTFRIHIRAEAINKARSAEPDTFDPERDFIRSSYRGSALVERYLDSTDKDIPDYAPENPDAIPAPRLPKLENFYRFRIISDQKFE